MKVTIIKGPLFEKVIKDAQKILYEFLIKIEKHN